MNKQEKIQLINSIPVIEYDTDGDTLMYALVENSDENRNKLLSIGVTEGELDEMVGMDGKDIDISLIGFEHAGASWYNGKQKLWVE